MRERAVFCSLLAVLLNLRLFLENKFCENFS